MPFPMLGVTVLAEGLRNFHIPKLAGSESTGGPEGRLVAMSEEFEARSPDPVGFSGSARRSVVGKVLGRGDQKWTPYSLNSDFNLVSPFSGAGMARKPMESWPVSGPAGRFAAETLKKL